MVGVSGPTLVVVVVLPQKFLFFLGRGGEREEGNVWGLESGVWGLGKRGVGCASSVCTFLEDIGFLSSIRSFIIVILYFKTRMTCEDVLFFSYGSNLPCTLYHPVLCICLIPVRNDEVVLGSAGALSWLPRFFISVRGGRGTKIKEIKGRKQHCLE